MSKRITDELLVSRAEHNDGNLTKLEEISLHQQHLEKLEYINKVCANLKVLYLQDNCIGKIENLGRLKKLQYLNLAMNNIEKIENLECCESLEKLDLTLNFVGALSDVKELKKNIFLKELIMMGNPCCKYDGYREYVIGHITQLQVLDGEEISKSERIKAVQKLSDLEPLIRNQESEYRLKREQEKHEVQKEIETKRVEYEDENLSAEEQRRNFYQSTSKHTPEFRLEASRKTAEYEEADERSRGPFRVENEYDKKAKSRRLFDDHGKPLNVNQANVDFHYDDSDDLFLKVELFLYKHLDTSLIDLDLHPNYLKVTIKDRIFQLRLLEDVFCDKAKAERSQTTGHLIITAPKVNPTLKVTKKHIPDPIELHKNKSTTQESKETLYLEVSGNNGTPDLTNIVQMSSQSNCEKLTDSDKSILDVPPLESLDD